MNDKDSNFLIFFNKNKKGFTLIELLAVIVILSIILLIATPLIMGVIRDARKGAFQNSAYGLMTAAENKYMLNELGGNGRDFTSIYENNSLKEGENLDYKGTTPKEGVIAVMKGKVGLAITDGVWCAKKGYNDSKITIIKYDEEACILEDVPEIPEIGMITKGFDSDKGVNVPELLSGMTPIKWNDDREEIVYDENTDNDSWYDDWYDYDNKLWANAKTKDGIILGMDTKICISIRKWL